MNGTPCSSTALDQNLKGADQGAALISKSRAVSWWPVHEFVTALVAQAEHLPIAGTPSWCELADGDPRKLLAVAVAGSHHVLRVEAAQEARAEASKAVAVSTDWPGVAREIQQRSNFRASRPWARREVENA